MPPTMSVQGKCRSMHYNNSKGDNDLVRSVFQNKSVFYGLLSRNNVFLGSSHRIETHLDVVVEVLEVQRSLVFELFIDEDIIEFW